MENPKEYQFNKITAFDELIAVMALPPNPAPSQSINSLIAAQNYLQKINDAAFQEGFEKGCDAAEKIKEL